MDFPYHFQRVATTDGYTGGRPLTDSIHGQHNGICERRWVKGTRGVTLMVFGEQEPRLPLIRSRQICQEISQEFLLEQLFLSPNRNCLTEGAKAPRGEGDIGFKEPFQFQKRLFVEDDIVDIVKRQTCSIQTKGDSVFGEGGVIFAPSKALFLGRGNNLTIAQQGGGTVMIKSRYTENVYRLYTLSRRTDRGKAQTPTLPLRLTGRSATAS